LTNFGDNGGVNHDLIPAGINKAQILTWLIKIGLCNLFNLYLLVGIMLQFAKFFMLLSGRNK